MKAATGAAQRRSNVLRAVPLGMHEVLPLCCLRYCTAMQQHVLVGYCLSVSDATRMSGPAPSSTSSSVDFFLIFFVASSSV